MFKGPDDFNNGYFYIRLNCTGLGFQANIVEENVLLSALPAFFSVFFLAARHPADFDCRPTAEAQVLARVSKVPWHPYHSGPALHCRVLSRSVSCYLSKSDKAFFVVVEY